MYKINNRDNLLKFVLLALIGLVVLVNASGMLVPILRNDDPVLYAIISKNMFLSRDFVYLIFNNNDWLDKPHLPFWISAISFRVFGVNSFAYIFPGFVFNLIGAYYTYSLAKYLYNANVGLLAALILLSSLHILLSSIDVRAEAYLLGEIMPACYYWLKYYTQTKIKYLFCGALFSALALMTKGLFSLITIMSGLIILAYYQKQAAVFFNKKWLIALLLTFIFILPELYCLYVQFDAIPSKVVFNHAHVSGMKWFFWDSQFGRFFNNGPIVKQQVSSAHYIFFVHTFLWSFLPWSVVYISSLYLIPKSFSLSVVTKTMYREKDSYIYLVGAFFPTFIVFSLTTFQLDYYTNILMPFAAILSSRWLYPLMQSSETRKVTIYFQITLALILMIIALSLFILIFKQVFLILLFSITVLFILVAVPVKVLSHVLKAIIYSTLSILLVFSLIMQVYVKVYAKYDTGYQISHLTDQQMPIIDYKVNSLTLEFYAQYGYKRVDSIKKLKQIPKPYYLIIKNSDLPLIEEELNKYIHIQQHFYGTTIDTVIANLLNSEKLKKSLTNYVIIQVIP